MGKQKGKQEMKWYLKMIWLHGFRAVEIFRVNARIARSENSAADSADFGYLDAFRGRGWFGLQK